MVNKFLTSPKKKKTYGKMYSCNFSFECNCTDTGFKGDTCEINIDDCESQPCTNGATCYDLIKVRFSHLHKTITCRTDSHYNLVSLIQGDML